LCTGFICLRGGGRWSPQGIIELCDEAGWERGPKECTFVKRQAEAEKQRKSSVADADARTGEVIIFMSKLPNV